MNIKILQEYLIACGKVGIEPSFSGLKAYKKELERIAV